MSLVAVAAAVAEDTALDAGQILCKEEHLSEARRAELNQELAHLGGRHGALADLRGGRLGLCTQGQAEDGGEDRAVVAWKSGRAG